MQRAGGRSPGLAIFAWAALAYNVLVILWGAYVRVSGSGAGCGSHWPLCNGVALPPSPTLHTVIEFSHRLTSGLSGMLALGLAVWVLWRRPKGDPVRFGAVLSLALIVFEGLIGGVQVLLGLTANSTDPARGFVQGLHLANTFALTAALLLTALWAAGAPRIRWGGQGAVGWGVAVALVGMLLLGMAGAVTALGDLLFRPEGAVGFDTVRSDFAATTGLIERLRVVHPLLALVVSGYLLLFAGWAQKVRPSRDAGRWSLILVGVIAAQMLAGFLNVALRAPNWMQLTHLLLACLMWLVTVRLCFAFLVAPPKRVARLNEVPA